MARSSSVAFQGSLCGRLEWSWQSAGPRLRHLRIVSVEDAIALGQDSGWLPRSSDLGPDGWGGASLGVDRVHQRAPRVPGAPRELSKRQAYASIAQRT